MELERLKNQLKLFKKAYKTLESSFSSNKLSDLEKDGVVQRFEYNVELLRKTCRVFLLYKWVNVSPTPKDVLKEIYKLWYILDLELFFDFLEVRNTMSHIYSEYVSKQSFNFIKKNYKSIWKLLSNLEKAI